MINNVTFTGMQRFMTAAAHEYLPTGKIFNKAELEAAEKASREAAENISEEAKALAEAAKKAKEVEFFNHRGNNIIDDELVAKLQGEAAAKSYARSHGVHVSEEAAESTIKINA